MSFKIADTPIGQVHHLFLDWSVFNNAKIETTLTLTFILIELWWSKNQP